jgi:hypothetical protein
VQCAVERNLLAHDASPDNTYIFDFLHIRASLSYSVNVGAKSRNNLVIETTP